MPRDDFPPDRLTCGEDEHRVVPEPAAFQGRGDISHCFIHKGRHACIVVPVLILDEVIGLQVFLGDLKGLMDRLESKVEKQRLEREFAQIS